MLESVSDLVSLAVMIIFVLVGIYYLFKISNLHRSIELRRHAERYYSLYDALDDEDDDEDRPDQPDQE
jgi:hypothetical protein